MNKQDIDVSRPFISFFLSLNTFSSPLPHSQRARARLKPMILSHKCAQAVTCAPRPLPIISTLGRHSSALSAASALVKSPGKANQSRRAACLAFLGIFWPFSRASALSTMPASEKWWDGETVAVVTGANKGIGYEIAHQLATQGLKTIVTARNAELGQEAAKKIAESTGSANVQFQRLDISDKASVEEFGKWAESELKTVNVLVNNAGIAFKGNTFGAEEAATTLATNFAGTRAVCERVLPLIPERGRIVNVCSLAGKLRILKSDALRARFEGASSADEVAQLGQEYVDAIKAGNYSEKGWPGSMYGVSKLCEATYTRVLAKQCHAKGISVYACCPGYVATDMSSWRGHKTTEQGAQTPVWLSLQAPLEGTGKFYSNCKEEPF